MTRRIVQLAGAGAQWALADDGTIWYWTGTAWQQAERGPLPEIRETAREFVARQEAAGVNLTKLALEAAVPPKRKPGRPRKNPQ